MNESSFDLLLELAIREDLSELGDVTSRAVFADETCTAGLYSKDTGVLAGAEHYTRVFRRLDPETRVSFNFHDGDSLSPGDLVAEVAGKTISVLTAERIALNFLGLPLRNRHGNAALQ